MAIKSTALLSFNSMQFGKNIYFAATSGSLQTAWPYDPKRVLFDNNLLGATAGDLLWPLQ
jgi:hypothetical protein